MSNQYQSVFQRYETKYMVRQDKVESLERILLEQMQIDQYGKTTIGSLYYDTPDAKLIRASLSKPIYKEKLRLRVYGTPNRDGQAFIEIKKKFKGIVYKRRCAMTYREAEMWLSHQARPPREGQIESEINYFMRSYEGLRPATAIFCERVALEDASDPTLRVTLDTNIRYRDSSLSLPISTGGKLLLPSGYELMEVKSAGGIPTWLAHALSELRIYPGPYSKYGNAYLDQQKLREVKEIA